MLSPAFSPNVTSYTTTVGSDCSQLVVSAVANDENASVSVRGTRMDPGSNTTTITVTAQDGSKKGLYDFNNKGRFCGGDNQSGRTGNDQSRRAGNNDCQFGRTDTE
ncbi:MAG: cadherin-like beta sandwich domain-containing protein [Lachnospira sp.]